MRRSLARNVLFLGLLQATMLVLPLVTLPYLARTLGVFSFGEMVLAQSIAAYLTVLVDYGFNYSAVRTVAASDMEPGALSAFYASVQGAKVLLLAIGAVAVLGVVGLWPQLGTLGLIILCALPASLNSIVFPQWLFQGLERMGVMTICATLSRFLPVPLIFLVVREPGDAWKAVLIAAATPLLGGVAAHAILLRDGTIRAALPGWPAVWARLREGGAMFVATVGVSLYATTNNVILGMLGGGAPAVGNFAAADKIRSASQGFIPPISNAFYPHVVRKVSADFQGLGRAVRPLLLLLGGLGAVASLALFLGADLLVHFVIGPGYPQAAGTLRILSPLPLLLAINAVLGVNVMLPLGMSTACSAILVGAGLVNVALLCLLTPRHGAAGAAVSLVITEALVVAAMAVMVFLDGRVFGGRVSGRDGARPAA